MIVRHSTPSSWLFVLAAVLLVAMLERGASVAQSPCPVGAAAEIPYGPGEDLERIDVALIREAEGQIDIGLRADGQHHRRRVARGLCAWSEGVSLARRRRRGEAKRIRR
jgi:hypothetical protein